MLQLNRSVGRAARKEQAERHSLALDEVLREIKDDERMLRAMRLAHHFPVDKCLPAASRSRNEEGLMTQVHNFGRERFTEMTDGNLSTKASVLGWPAGFFPEEFTIGRERFTRIAAERLPGSIGAEVTHWLYRSRLRNCRVVNG